MKRSFSKYLVWTVLGPLLFHISAHGQDADLLPRARTTLNDAAEAQRKIVTQLNQILKEQRIALSDGALVALLQNVIIDERKVVDAIQDLGKRTLGRTLAELTDSEKTELAALTRDQESCADRYASFQTGAEDKALERPNSPFARIVVQAAEANLGDRMAATPQAVGENQLALALQEITDILSVLEEMASFLKGGLEEEEEPAGGQGPATVALPLLIGSGGNYQLATFSWTGDIIDSLGVILRAVGLLEEQAAKQREIAEKVKKLADQGVAAPQLPLATAEWEIRFLVRDIAGQLGIIDEFMRSQIELAVGNIDVAIPHLESGSLPEAVEPTRLAADQLTAAAKSLKKTWESILEQLALYTALAEGLPMSGQGIPHGASDEMIKRIRELVFALLRVTGGMRIVMDRQAALQYSTAAATDPTSATMECSALAAEQRAVLDLIAEQVIPFNVLAPPYDARHGPLKRRDYISHLLIEDASQLLQLAAQDLDAEHAAEAVPRQKRARGFLEEALAEMVLALQQLLGQYSPPAMAKQDGTSTGIAIPASGAGEIESGWAWNLPPRKRTEILQAFRGSFPDRYASLIQLYFKSIAGEDIGP